MKNENMKGKPLSLLLVFIGIAVACLIYIPGLEGPWLVDDDNNLRIFTTLPDKGAFYSDIIFSNNSGPLGRPISMISFAINHALGLFSTYALKTTNLLIHLLNGLLLFALLNRLFGLKAPTLTQYPLILAAMITVWWLLLPLHISSVLYIVQRMTLLASFFSLACCLTYVSGREVLSLNRRIGLLLIGISIFLLFPLAIFSKESSFATLAWLVLIELFFFTPPTCSHNVLRPALTLLVTLSIAAGILIALLLPIQEWYVWREFTLSERLLTQARVLWSYIGDIFIPNSSSMGLYQDDYQVSRGLFDPWTTLASIAGLALMLVAAIRLASSKWWALSFGVFFYLSGHLIESTIIPLEIYFEHRNYLPSIGLLIATSTAISMLWPWRQTLLILFFSLYLGILTFATLQRSHIWGNKNLLHETAVLSHPQSVRAWTDYSESLFSNHHYQLSLESAYRGAQQNPAFASISYIQMISIYCRIQTPPPAWLIERTSAELLQNSNLASSFTTPLAIGLEDILTRKRLGRCKNSDFSPLAKALIHVDKQLIKHYGQQRQGLWFLRLTLSEWLIEIGHEHQALKILQDTWDMGNKSTMPMIGLVLARTLTEEKATKMALQTLSELTAVTHDAPDDFRKEMTTLYKQNSRNH